MYQNWINGFSVNTWWKKEINLNELKELLNYSPLELGANWQICYKVGYIPPLENLTENLSSQSVEEYCLTDRRQNLLDSFWENNVNKSTAMVNFLTG